MEVIDSVKGVDEFDFHHLSWFLILSLNISSCCCRTLCQLLQGMPICLKDWLGVLSNVILLIETTPIRKPNISFFELPFKAIHWLSGKDDTVRISSLIHQGYMLYLTVSQAIYKFSMSTSCIECLIIQLVGGVAEVTLVLAHVFCEGCLKACKALLVWGGDLTEEVSLRFRDLCQVAMDRWVAAKVVIYSEGWQDLTTAADI